MGFYYKFYGMLLESLELLSDLVVFFLIYYLENRVGWMESQRKIRERS